MTPLRHISLAAAALRNGLATALLVGILLGVPGINAAMPATPPPRTVFAHLFEWKWTNVAEECAFLGEKGYSAVQVSPPNEHIDHKSASHPHAWWARYQPASYDLVSRSGDASDFKDMVDACALHEVGVYVDVVINHMGDQVGVGVNGSTFDSGQQPSYPAVPYSASDFHYQCTIADEDYAADTGDPALTAARAWRVRHCSLGGLPDLVTASSWVQDRIVDYLQHLVDLGVAGFRIDAAKHIDPADLQAILSRVNGEFYVFQEVIDTTEGSFTSSVRADEYLAEDVTEFLFQNKVGQEFASGDLKWFHAPLPLGEDWGFIPSDKAVVFIENHDTERGHGAGWAPVNNRGDAALYTLANVFMLAYPYGYPKIMSSYDYAAGMTEDGPPHDGNGNTQSVPTGCFGAQWKCQHRWRALANMVAFRNHTSQDFFVNNWWDNGNDQIAFGRGDSGFVVINREGSDLNRTFDTGLPAGTYCNIVATDFDPVSQSCADPSATVLVDQQGWAQFNVPAMTAAAIHVGAVAGSAPAASVAFTVDGFVTSYGQAIRVVGNVPELGNWAPSSGALLQWKDQDTWSGSVTFGSGAGQFVQYKYVVTNPDGSVIWETSIPNRVVSVPNSGTTATVSVWDSP